MGSNYNIDDYNDSSSSNDDLMGPMTSTGEVPLDLEAPIAPISVSLIDEDFSNTTSSSSSSSSSSSAAAFSKDQEISLDIVKEFDRDYMKLRSKLVELIEKNQEPTANSKDDTMV